jgi:hypothetical protein
MGTIPYARMLNTFGNDQSLDQNQLQINLMCRKRIWLTRLQSSRLVHLAGSTVFLKQKMKGNCQNQKKVLLITLLAQSKSMAACAVILQNRATHHPYT